VSGAPTHAPLCVCVCLSVCLSVYVCVVSQTGTQRKVHVRLPASAPVCVCVCVCACVCVCVCVCRCRRLAHSGACVLISIHAHGRTALCVICIDGLQDLKVVQQRLVHRRTLVFGRRPVPLHPVVRLTQRERERPTYTRRHRESGARRHRKTQTSTTYTAQRDAGPYVRTLPISLCGCALMPISLSVCACEDACGGRVTGIRQGR
jgi:hypothetical protein